MISQLLRHTKSLIAALFQTRPDWEDFDRAQRSLVAYRDVVTALKSQHARALDEVYLERNRLVAALAKHYPSGVAQTPIEGWDAAWFGCVFIDLPTGQASWHFHERDAHLFSGLPKYETPWDGHTTPEKYERLSQLKPPSRRSSLVVEISAAPMRNLLAVATSEAARDVLVERERQISVEGWTPQHDDRQYNTSDMAVAGACYLLHAAADDERYGHYLRLLYRDTVQRLWPWSEKPKPAEARRHLVKGCSLGLAEIERRDRAAQLASAGDAA